MVNPAAGKDQLSYRAKVAWATAGTLLGILPSHLLFYWMSIQADSGLTGWAWSLDKYNLHWGVALAVKMVLNVLLFLAWGAVHSLSAQGWFQGWLSRGLGIPPQAMRMVFMINTAVSSLALLALWQPFHVTVWAMPGVSMTTNYLLSHFFYWVFLLSVDWHIMKYFDALEFFGLSQLFHPEKPTAGTPVLITNGTYGLVRHPMYLFIMAALLLTPYMTLDRLVMAAGVSAYLYFAIPYEEAKCVNDFGPAYLEYRKHAPAVVPFYRPYLSEKGAKVA